MQLGSYDVIELFYECKRNDCIIKIVKIFGKVKHQRAYGTVVVVYVDYYFVSLCCCIKLL